VLSGLDPRMVRGRHILSPPSSAAVSSAIPPASGGRAVPSPKSSMKASKSLPWQSSSRMSEPSSSRSSDGKPLRAFLRQRSYSKDSRDQKELPSRLDGRIPRRNALQRDVKPETVLPFPRHVSIPDSSNKTQICFYLFNCLVGEDKAGQGIHL
jgi:hypothetical protein